MGIYLRSEKPKNEYTLKEALELFLQRLGLEITISDAQVKAAWKEVTGDLVAKLTEKTYLKDDTLYVKVKVAALKQELMMRKTNLILLLNKALDKNQIENIIIY